MVGSKVPIFIDGDMRTGNDVFKCVAFGGGLCVFGETGAAG